MPVLLPTPRPSTRRRVCGLADSTIAGLLGHARSSITDAVDAAGHGALLTTATKSG